jgi:hypothetical protein
MFRKSRAFLPRYHKFESISLQRRVRNELLRTGLSRDFFLRAVALELSFFEAAHADRTWHHNHGRKTRLFEVVPAAS